MKNKPFEGFIKKLLEGHDTADKLRAMKTDDSNLKGSVELILLEAEFDSYFIDVSQSPYVVKQITDKLDLVEKVIQNSTVAQKNWDWQTQRQIIRFIKENVEAGKTPTREVLEYVNQLYRRYK